MNYQLFHGNCLEVIPQLIDMEIEIDAGVIDPPYGINGGKGGDSRLCELPKAKALGLPST